MPVSNPSSGRAFIWLITCFLFISIVAGGACLVAYMTLPESQVPSWIPVAGVTLVCLPWAFWLFTFLYRIISRVCGFRLSNANGDGGGGGGGGRREGNGGAANFANANRNVDVEAAGQANSVRETAVGQQDDHRGLNRASSVASHESEMPLANSMAS